MSLPNGYGRLPSSNPPRREPERGLWNPPPEFKDEKSALRAASRHNPRNLPCPTCGEPDRLTPADQRKGYQCDECADRDEGMGW
jgi:hypothetical protein